MNHRKTSFPEKHPSSSDIEHFVSESHSMTKRTPFSFVLMAHYLKSLGFIDYINERISWDPKQCKYDVFSGTQGHFDKMEMGGHTDKRVRSNLVKGCGMICYR